MAPDTRTPSLRLTLSEPAPAQAPVGARIVVRVEVARTDAQDHPGMTLQVTAPDGVMTEHPIADDTSAVSITLDVPTRVGEHVWRARLPDRDDTLSIAIHAKPHTTSLAVWHGWR